MQNRTRDMHEELVRGSNDGSVMTVGHPNWSSNVAEDLDRLGWPTMGQARMDGTMISETFPLTGGLPFTSRDALQAGVPTSGARRRIS